MIFLLLLLPPSSWFFFCFLLRFVVGEASGKDFSLKVMLRYCMVRALVALIQMHGFQSGSGCVMMMGQFGLTAEVICTYLY